MYALPFFQQVPLSGYQFFNQQMRPMFWKKGERIEQNEISYCVKKIVKHQFHQQAIIQNETSLRPFFTLISVLKFYILFQSILTVFLFLFFPSLFFRENVIHLINYLFFNQKCPEVFVKKIFFLITNDFILRCCIFLSFCAESAILSSSNRQIHQTFPRSSILQIQKTQSLFYQILMFL